MVKPRAIPHLVSRMVERQDRDSWTPGQGTVSRPPDVMVPTPAPVYEPATWERSASGFVLVASSEAPQAIKDRADYICDGAADQIEINEALNVDPDGLVLLSAGSFYLSSPGVTLPAGSTLMGSGRVSTYVYASSGTTAITMGADCTLKGLYAKAADGVKVVQMAAGCLLDDCAVEYGTGHGVGASGGGYKTIRNCDIVTSGASSGHGIYMTTHRYLVVRDSRITGGDVAIRLEIGSTSARVLISGCLIEGSGQEGIYLSRTGDIGRVTITDNVISANSGEAAGYAAIRIDASDTANARDGDKLIQGNQILHTGSNAAPGISLTGVRYAIVADNYLEDAGQHGVVLDDTKDSIVSGNLINMVGRGTTNTYDGVHLSGDSDSNLIVGNKVIPDPDAPDPKTRYGINISASTCDANIVVNNDLRGTWGTGPLNDAGTGTILVDAAHATYGDNWT